MVLPLIVPPPPLILLVHPCLLMHHLYLSPPFCLLFSPAGCRIASCCTAFAINSLDAQLPLNAVAGCSFTSCCPASAAHPLSLLLPLDAPPPSPTPICLLLALVGCHVTSHCTTFTTYPLYALPPHNAPAGCSVGLSLGHLQLILLMCHHLSTHRLVVALPLSIPASQHATSTSHFPFAFCFPQLVVTLLLIAPPLPLTLSMRNHLSMLQQIVTLPLVAPPLPPFILMRICLSMRQLVVALLLVVPLLLLIVLTCCCLSMCSLHLPLPFASCFLMLVVAVRDHDVINRAKQAIAKLTKAKDPPPIICPQND